jgi:hypothetical protein
MRTVDLPPRGLLVSPLLSVGPWLSLVERLLGVQEVASSNLAGPTIKSPAREITEASEQTFCGQRPSSSLHVSQSRAGRPGGRAADQPGRRRHRCARVVDAAETGARSWPRRDRGPTHRAWRPERISRGSSQRLRWAGGRMTGMRSCRGRSRSLAVVVTMAQARCSRPSGPGTRSHRPASHQQGFIAQLKIVGPAFPASAQLGPLVESIARTRQRWRRQTRFERWIFPPGFPRGH